MKKLCFMGAELYGTGGVEAILTQVANQLVNDYEVLIISDNGPIASKYMLDERVNVKVLDVYKYYATSKRIDYYITKFFALLTKMLGIRNSASNFAQFMNLVSRYPITMQKRIARVINQYNPDLTIGVGRGAVLLGLISDQIVGKKIGWQHSSYDCYMNIGDNYAWPNIRKYVIQSLKKLDRMYVLTEKDQHKYMMYNNLYTHVMPNFIDDFQPLKSNLTEKKMIAVGRLSPEKQFDVLIDIWYEFVKGMPDWKLDIYGVGPEKSKLELKIKKYQLENSVTLKGFTNKINEEFLKHSIMLMTSKFEGFPLTIIESFSCGIPIVAFNIDATEYLIEEGKEGFLVSKEDTQLFIEKMNLLSRDYSLRIYMSDNCKEKALKYTKSRIIRLWNDELNELLNN